jgi:hypothetical protein
VAENKTQFNDADVKAFLDTVADERKRQDCLTLVDMMREITGEEPQMFGASIVGFGSYHYKYESGREGDMILTGFSPRKQNLTLYVMAGFDKYDEMRQRLGKHKVGKSCLYVNRLADVDQGVLREMVQQSVDHMRATNPLSTD